MRRSIQEPSSLGRPRGTGAALHPEAHSAYSAGSRAQPAPMPLAAREPIQNRHTRLRLGPRAVRIHAARTGRFAYDLACALGRAPSRRPLRSWTGQVRRSS
jgi:hypothetical protein